MRTRKSIGAPGDRLEKGFGLIEVLMGIALLGIIGVALLSGLTTAVKSNIVVERNVAAVNVAQSQLEDLKTQPYVSAPTLDAAHYSLVTGVHPGYLVGSADRTGAFIEGGPIGIPWNAETGSAVGADAGLQNIAVVVKQGTTWATGTVAYEIDIYKVKQ
jgi:prepilin-type N-terminal cleavage/methylation domain-containing protein